MGGKRRSTEEVRQILNHYGYILDENEIFKTVKTRMKVKNNEGYQFLVRLNDLPRYEPIPFHISNPYTISNIRDVWLPKYAPDYELLSDTYSGHEVKMQWKHKYINLPTLEMDWHCFQYQRQHPELGNMQAGNSNRKKSSDVLNKILSILNSEKKYEGWKMCNIENFEYKSHIQIIEFIHKDGFKSSSEIDYILNKNGLILFHIKQPEITLHNIQTYITLNGIKYTLKDSQEYKGRHENLLFICPDHGEFENNFNQVCFKKVDCPDCLLEKISGEKSVHYKPELTDEDRNRHRYLQGAVKWSKDVKKRDNYTCQCCGNNDIQLHAHHLDGYSWCKDKRLDINNGITLCHLCHKDAEDGFHKLYTNRNNTKEQFIEWITKYRINYKSALKTLINLQGDEVRICV